MDLRQPVACTLEARDLNSRMAEWRTFAHQSVDVAEREAEQRLRLRLRASNDDLVAAVDLARRERGCCRFFEFVVEILADGNWLVISVPPEAVGRLDALTDLLA
jgi:hypothetical protein